MSRFRKNIHVGEEDLDFAFTQLNYPDGTGYFITVADRDKNIYSLDLKKTERNEWRIVKKDHLPAWLVEMEPMLVSSVTEARRLTSPAPALI